MFQAAATTTLPEPTTAEAGFSGRRAAQIVGITYRQLDYWARTDLIRPTLADATGSGSRRLYSRADLMVLLLIRTLIDGGARLERVRELIDALPDYWSELDQYLVLARPTINHPGVFVAGDVGLDRVVAECQGPVTMLSVTQLDTELTERITAVEALWADHTGPVTAPRPLGSGWADRL